MTRRAGYRNLETSGGVRGRNWPRDVGVAGGVRSQGKRRAAEGWNVTVYLSPRGHGDGAAGAVMDTSVGRMRSGAFGEHRTGGECLDRPAGGAVKLAEGGAGTKGCVIWRKAGTEWAVSYLTPRTPWRPCRSNQGAASRWPAGRCCTTCARLTPAFAGEGCCVHQLDAFAVTRKR